MIENASGVKTSKPKKRRKVLVVVLILIFVPIILFFSIVGPKIYQEAKEEHWFEYQAMRNAGVLSESLIQRGKEFGLSEIEDIPVYRIDQDKMYGIENRDGGTLIEGCYKEAGYCTVVGIYIRNGLEGSDLDAILAHEYVHAMYAIDNLANDTTLNTDIKTIYNNTPGMQQISLKDYDDEDRTIEEVFAYSCTDAKDSWLTKYVLRKCNEYIDRSKIELLY